jgi:hypothetical protein
VPATTLYKIRPATTHYKIVPATTHCKIVPATTHYKIVPTKPQDHPATNHSQDNLAKRSKVSTRYNNCLKARLPSSITTRVSYHEAPSARTDILAKPVLSPATLFTGQKLTVNPANST